MLNVLTRCALLGQVTISLKRDISPTTNPADERAGAANEGAFVPVSRRRGRGPGLPPLGAKVSKRVQHHFDHKAVYFWPDFRPLLLVSKVVMRMVCMICATILDRVSCQASESRNQR